jgi:acyl-CoA thioesterase FadM
MPWFELNIDEYIGTPFVSVKYDIFAPLTPRSELRCKVLVSKVGQISVEFHDTIINDGGLKFVEAETVNVFVNNQSMTKIDIPEKYRVRLESYVQACGGIDE